MNILVITNNYPSLEQPNSGAFVYNLIQELGKTHTITIISPKKINFLLKKKQASYGPEISTVKRPLFVSASNKNILGFNTRTITETTFRKSVLSEIKKMEQKPDLIYCHFLINALPVIDYVEHHKIPLVIASGESTYDTWEKQPQQIQLRMQNLVDHIICVSKENKDQLTKLNFDPNKMSVIPNAVDYEKFQPLNRGKCKQKLGIDPEKFTIGFIGHFIHRKGPNRIIQAIKKLKDEGIQLICAGGEGGLDTNNFTLELGKVPNYQLPEIYNAFDIFVLPTLHEGSCNVIEEAKACGIPIISSKGTSVEEQIDKKTGILVDPLNIEEIKEAIKMLKTDKRLYNDLHQNLLNKRGENSLQNRACRINKVLSEAANEIK